MPSSLSKTEQPASQEETCWVNETLNSTSYNKILFTRISDSKLDIIRFFFTSLLTKFSHSFRNLPLIPAKLLPLQSRHQENIHITP